MVKGYRLWKNGVMNEAEELWEEDEAEQERFVEVEEAL